MARIATVLLIACCASAQQAPFTMDQVLGSAFPSSLAAAPAGGRVAWVSNARGVRNIMVAEPPAYQARKVTAYAADDGQELDGLAFTPDANSIVYVRGLAANGNGEHPNPALDAKGAGQAVWIVALDGSSPRRLGEGEAAAVSPRGDRVAFVHSGDLWLAALDGKSPAAQAFAGRGTCDRPVWSPDGSRIAFESRRGDHSFIGVFEPATGTLRYLDAATDLDSQPEWSPDSRSIAFVRTPSTGLRVMRGARRTGEPWSIRVAPVDGGAGREIWRAAEGKGSVPREIVTRNQLLWADGGRIVFPWEADGWTHLYSVTAEGGKATLLTPGSFEVEHVALSHDRRDVLYSSNQGDTERRHLWRVAAGGGAPSSLTTGEGIEWSPTETSDGKAVAFFRSDARLPAHPAIRVGSGIRDMDPAAVPADFPTRQLVVPQPVTFPGADGMPVHGQLFLPPNRSAAKAPAVVFFHGGSRRQMLLGWHYGFYYHNAYALNQFLASRGYVVLAVNYRSGIGYGMEFREALNFGPSGASEYNDVQGAGFYLRSRPEVDPDRIGAWGGSYGGYLTAMALARASDLYRAGVDFHGVHNWATELNIPRGEPDYMLAYQSSPMAFADTWRSPVLFIAGDDDPDVQFNQTVIMANALRQRKVPFERLIFPDEVHDFLLYRTWRDGYSAAARFLDAHLK